VADSDCIDDCSAITQRLRGVHGDTEAFALRLHRFFTAIAQRLRGVHGDPKAFALKLRLYGVFTAIAASPFN
jgi:hypothetical protein